MAADFLAGAFLAGAFFAAVFLAGAFFAAVFLAGAFFAAVFLAAVFLAGVFLAGGLLGRVAARRPSRAATWVARSSRLAIPTAPSWRETSERTVETISSVPCRPRSRSSSTRARASSVCRSPFFTSSDTSSSAFFRVMCMNATPASM